MITKILKGTLGRGARALGAVLMSALLAGLAPAAAFAASNNMDIQSAFFGQIAVSGVKQGGAGNTINVGNNSAASTTTVVMNLSYSGTAASANITISGNCLTFYAPEGTVDTTIGSATCGISGGTYDLTASTVTNLGQLCDLINGVGTFALNGNANGGAPTGGNYHCTLVDGIRSDVADVWLPSVTEASGVNNLNAVGGYSIPIATDTIISLGIIPAQGRHVILNNCTVNSAGTPAIQVFGVPYKFGGSNVGQFGAALGGDANLAFLSPALTANTSDLLSPFAAAATAVPPSQPFMEFAGSGGGYSYALNLPAGHSPAPPVGTQYNGHVVVRANNYGTGNAPEASTNFISCNWMER